MTIEEPIPMGLLPKQKLLRVFVAINLIGDVAKLLRSTMDELRQLDLARSVRWVKPENLHLTLLFLGEQRSERVTDLANRVKMALLNLPSFSLQLDGMGAFPTMHQPQVIWWGLKPSVELGHLAVVVRQTSLNVGIELDDKPFKPHLTLGRVRVGAHLGRVAELLSVYAERNASCAGLSGAEQVVYSVTLYKSVLQPTGPVYFPLDVFKLRE